MLKGLDTSAVKYITDMSSFAVSAQASTNAVDLSNFTFCTLLVSSGSTGDGVITFDVLRSSASDGTFHNFGASIPGGVLGGLQARSFVLGSSDVWYKTYRVALGAGSPVIVSIFAAQGTRAAPVDQYDSGGSTVSYSVINSA